MSNTDRRGVSAQEASSGNYRRPCVGSCISHVAVVLWCVYQACSEEILGGGDKHTVGPQKDDRHVETLIFYACCDARFLYF